MIFDYGIRDKAFHVFRALGIDQANAMGPCTPEAVWTFRRPDRNSFGGGDGVAFPFSTKHLIGSAARHVTGDKQQVYGSKYTILSARINGQYLSRLILDLRHTHKDHLGSAKDESSAVLDSMPDLCDLSGGPEAPKPARSGPVLCFPQRFRRTPCKNQPLLTGDTTTAGRR